MRTVLIGFLLLIGMPVAAYAQAELIVRLRDGVGPSSLLRAVAADTTAPALREAEMRPVFQSRSGLRASPAIPAYVVSVPDSAALAGARAQLAARPDVRYVQPNVRYMVHSAAPPDPLLDSLTHLPLIRAPEAWQVTTGDPSVRVGVVDTGFWLGHPDLAGQFWINPEEDANGNGVFDPFPASEGGDLDGIDNDGNGLVDDVIGYDFVDRPDEVLPGDYAGRDPNPSADEVGPARAHGTAVAGVLAAAKGNGEGIAGVAPGVQLVPLRAFGSDGRGNTDDIAAAIVYAAEMDLDVVNLSFGRDVASPLLEEAIQYASGRGTLVVASAGNSGGDDPHYPSDYPEVVSVAYLNAGGTDLAPLGNYGLGLDLGAPGAGIYTTRLPGPDEPPTPETLYGRVSGSSVAAPQVSAAAALVRSLDPSLSPSALRSILTATATDIAAEGWDHRTGAGRLDVASALAQALPARAEITQPAHNGGTTGGRVPIIGAAIDPGFVSYAVDYAAGDTVRAGEEDFDWQRIAGPIYHQVLNDTLAVWDTGALPEGVYTLRLVVQRRAGHAVEDRRRFYIDRTPPAITPRVLASGLVDDRWGLVADVATDDLTTLTATVQLGGQTCTQTAEHRARRHGIACADETGRGGEAQVTLTAANTSGLTSSYTTTISIPPQTLNARLFENEELDVPRGYLLPQATDYDGDGLKEIVFNQLAGGSAFGDTVQVYEWDGSGFARARSLSSNLIPRDVRDTNGNGWPELLLSLQRATLLAEPSAEGRYPDTEVFRSTEISAALLDDLDGDGRGEIIGHDGAAWHVLEYDPAAGTWQPAARLENPTGSAGAKVTPNAFTRLEALTGDFDGDGRRDLLVGDLDGDWIIYEAAGDDTYEVAWTYETARYNAGARFAAGDFDGDGIDEFATYTDSFKGSTREEDEAPSLGVYYLWDQSGGDDAYRLVRTLPVAGNVSPDGALRAADFDGDGRDELAVLHPPALYVLDYDDGTWNAVYQHGFSRHSPSDGLRSRALAAADFDGDGAAELVAGAADGRMRRFVYRRRAEERPPPRWAEAVSAGAESVRLAWRAPGADSVTVYRGPPEGALDPAAATADSSLTLPATRERRYALRAWYAAAGSPLSASRRVRPHAGAVVTEVAYPDTSTVRLTFSEPLAPATRADQFRLGAEAVRPASLLLGAGGRAAILRFDRRPPGRADTLRWRGVRDAEGMPAGQTAVAVSFPEPDPATLVLRSWDVRSYGVVALVFSHPLRVETATNVENYAVEPTGRVALARVDPDNPMQVMVNIEGVAIGPVGRSTSLRIERMESRAGATLRAEGYAVQLAEPADGLDDVFIYPNPHHARRHSGPVTVAGLPPEATVQVFSTEGLLVAELEETGRDGGVQWPLTDRYGRRVPAGIYLVRVEAPDEGPVMKKVAVIR